MMRTQLALVGGRTNKKKGRAGDLTAGPFSPEFQEMATSIRKRTKSRLDWLFRPRNLVYGDESGDRQPKFWSPHMILGDLNSIERQIATLGKALKNSPYMRVDQTGEISEVWNGFAPDGARRLQASVNLETGKPRLYFHEYMGYEPGKQEFKTIKEGFLDPGSKIHGRASKSKDGETWVPGRKVTISVVIEPGTPILKEDIEEIRSLCAEAKRRGSQIDAFELD